MFFDKNQIDFDLVPTPCYLLDEKKLLANLELLQRVEEESGAKILCALKGFAMWSAFPTVRKYLSGATASSLHEAKLIESRWGTLAHMCAPVYVPNEIKELSLISSHMTFNSLSEWDRYKEYIMTQELSPALRINPEYSEIEVPLYDPAGSDSRLGVKAEQLKELPIGIEGLHFHVMCEQDSYVLERVLKHVEEKFGHLFSNLKWINFGGGHHITRSDYDVNHLIELIQEFKGRHGLEIFLEPGEAVGWEAGYLVSQVLDVFPTGEEKEIAMLDTSFTCHMPDCLEMPYKPFVVGAIQPNSFFPTYIMGGMSCLAGDQIGDYSFVKPLKVGDRVVFHDMIHYTMVKSNTFNGVRLPSIAIWTQEDELEIVKTYDYQDYEMRLS